MKRSSAVQRMIFSRSSMSNAILAADAACRNRHRSPTPRPRTGQPATPSRRPDCRQLPRFLGGIRQLIETG